MNESVSRDAGTSMWIARLDKHVKNTPERFNSLRPSLIIEPRTKIVDSEVSEGRCWFQSVYVQILPSSTIVVPRGVFGKSCIWRYTGTHKNFLQLTSIRVTAGRLASSLGLDGLSSRGGILPTRL